MANTEIIQRVNGRSIELSIQDRPNFTMCFVTTKCANQLQKCMEYKLVHEIKEWCFVCNSEETFNSILELSAK